VIGAPGESAPAPALSAGAAPARHGMAAQATLSAPAPGELLSAEPRAAAMPGAPARSRSLLPESVPAAAALAAALMLSSAMPLAIPADAVPGELSAHAAEEAPASRNGANAPADNPEDADALPARALRPGLPRRAAELPAGEAAAVGTAVEAGVPAPAEGSRATPGMSQPGSAIARLPPPGQVAYLNRSYIRLYRPPLTLSIHYLRQS